MSFSYFKKRGGGNTHLFIVFEQLTGMGIGKEYAID
jgi:hypothetical protein